MLYWLTLKGLVP